MARTSQAHLDARRRQILDGARRAFTLNGFHATSMQDVLREVDLSAGAVYRYFRGKEEIIAAIAMETLGDVRTAFDAVLAADPTPPLDEILGRVLWQVGSTGEPGEARARARLILQVWSETLRNAELAAALERGFTEMAGAWQGLVESYQRSGRIRADIPAEQVARTLLGLVQGYLSQQALFDEVTPEVFQNGLRALMSAGAANVQ
ncbi:TetR family transcriptional regulator [Wenjunlia vitaminophila]|uniref:TetR family transcriptional regulator n=1 Tax=Wenjunlia vitaminophila TaxID=76728 RepID=A0A0T6LUQ8_WENVI|nr:TetR/AcrR family transcriptional regulator [Wenjunlia vitaminophila]KRV49782.1 TetR family transcriptional regulator [Wenjunlia vitaminophila]